MDSDREKLTRVLSDLEHITGNIFTSIDKLNNPYLSEFCLSTGELFVWYDALDDKEKKNYPLDFQICCEIGITDFKVKNIDHLLGIRPEDAMESDDFHTYWESDPSPDDVFFHSNTRYKNFKMVGYSAHAHHVYGFDTIEIPYRFVDSLFNENKTYLELVVSMLGGQFSELTFYKENGVVDSDFDASVKKLGLWFKELATSGLDHYFSENAKRYVGVDLYQS